MFRSSNPVLTREESFAPQYRSATPTQQMPGYGPTFDGNQGRVVQPGQGQFGGPQGGFDPHQGHQPPQQEVMTIEDVATKFGIIMGILVLTAAAAWMLLPLELLYPAMIGSAIVGLITVLFVTFRRKVSPGAVLFYAAVEGIFIGGFSKVFEMFYPGIVIQAVLGTFVAAAVVLVAYRFFNLGAQVSKIRKIIVISTIGFALAMLVNFGFALGGINLGLRAGVTGEVSGLAILVSAVGVALAAINLVLDFEFIENGVRNRVPAQMSWVGAFGLAVTMIWLYTEILRILSYIRR